MARPDYGRLERRALLKAFDANEIAQGRNIGLFESAFANYIGTSHASSCSSGTTALHLALKALGVGPGDEVICPNLTFVAVPNAILYCGAKPVFSDVDRESWIMTPEHILDKVTTKTKAVIAVHSYGVPCDMSKIMMHAALYEYAVIEDCSQAIGARTSDKLVGSFGDLAIFSLFANKIITTGEGGMICGNSPHVFRAINSLKNHCHTRDYAHADLGYNYRMTNLQASLGLAQLKRIEEIIDARDRIKVSYNYLLNDNFERNGFVCFTDLGVCWLYTVLVSDRDKFRERMLSNGIETRPVFQALNTLEHLPSKGRFPNSSFIAAHGVSLPTYPGLSKEAITHICEVANDCRFLSKL